MLYEKERKLKEEHLKAIKKEIKKGNFQDYNFEEEELDEDDYYYDDKDL